MKADRAQAMHWEETATVGIYAGDRGLGARTTATTRNEDRPVILHQGRGLNTIVNVRSEY
jgi:hypothetical protein